MSYKLLKEHEDKFEMQHPNGNTFYVAKKGLNKKVVSHIKSLEVKGYFDGGEVEPNASYMPSKKIEDPTVNLTQSQDYTNPAIPTPMPGPIVEQQPERQPTSEVSAPAPAIQAQETIPQQPEQQYPDMISGYNKISQGLGANAQAQSDLAKQNADTYAQLQKDLKIAEETHQKSRQAQVKELEALQDQASKDIDPNRYWGSLNTGNKIAASIGLILGGIGAGMVRGENQALKVINNAIDNDIKSQMSDKTNKRNLYRDNLDKFKDEQDAYRQTKLEMLTIADSRLKQAESNAKSQEAKAALQVARGELEMKAAPLIEEAAQKRSQREIIRMAQTNPEAITPGLAQYLPEKDRERFVPGAGFALTAEGAKKIKEEIKPDRDDAINALNRLADIRKKYGREIGNREAVAEADTLRGILRGKLRTFLVGPGAVTESEQKILNDILQDPTSLTTNDATVYKRIDSLKSAINNSYMNKAKLAGLDTTMQAQDSTQMEVKTMNGIPYKKVSGGWAPLKTGK